MFKITALLFQVCSLLLYLQVLLYISIAILLGNLSDYFFIESPTASDKIKAYGFAAGIVMSCICASVVSQSGNHLGRMAGLVSRICLLDAIYNKVRKK